MVVAIASAACSQMSVNGVNLDGTSWVALSVAGKPPPAGQEPTMKFEDGRASGSAGCNGYATQQPVEIDHGRVRMGDTLSTVGRCVASNGADSPVMAIEVAFLGILRVANHIAIVDDHLVIGGSPGDIIFARRG